jgi:hypothetical protein
MGIVTTANFSKALYPGVSEWFGDEYNKWDEIYSKVFETKRSMRAFEEDVQRTGLGLASEKGEGQAPTFDSDEQSYITRYAPIVYALGIKVTREMVEDNLYDSVGQEWTRMLASSGRETKEIIHANVLNRAFTSTYAGADGKELCATDHPNWTGGTWKNELTTAAPLSEASIEQAVIDIGNWTNDRGQRVRAQIKQLIVPKELEFEATRILKTVYRTDTSHNDISAIYALGKVPKMLVNPYMTNTNDWFLQTNVRNGLKTIQRRDPEFTTDNEHETQVASFIYTERYVPGWSDPKGIFGSPGS